MDGRLFLQVFGVDAPQHFLGHRLADQVARAGDLLRVFLAQAGTQQLADDAPGAQRVTQPVGGRMQFLGDAGGGVFFIWVLQWRMC